jgi:hypothetical protein
MVRVMVRVLVRVLVRVVVRVMVRVIVRVRVMAWVSVTHVTGAPRSHVIVATPLSATPPQFHLGKCLK